MPHSAPRDRRCRLVFGDCSSPAADAGRLPPFADGDPRPLTVDDEDDDEEDDDELSDEEELSSSDEEDVVEAVLDESSESSSASPAAFA